MSELIIKETESKKTGRVYRAVWLRCDGMKDRLITLDWFHFACVYNLFDKVKAGAYPVHICFVEV